MRRIAVSIHVVVLLLLFATAASAGASPWQWANPLPTGDDISALTSNGTLTVAIVGSAGGGRSLLSSNDGVQWRERAMPDGVFASGLAWGGIGFVGVGKAGAVITSNNGLDWIRAGTIDPAFELRSVAWGNGRYVGVGMQFIGSEPSGVIASSPDALTWTVHAHPLTEPSAFNDVTYANGRFVLAGSPSLLATSTDGMTWTYNTFPFEGDIEDVAGCAGRFVATASDSPFAFPVRYSHTLVSVDGSHWTLHLRTLPATIVGDIACHDDRYVVVGGMGGPDSYVAHSQDGIVWSTNLVDTINAPFAATWDGSRFVIGGEFGFIATSGDGLEWTTRSNAQGQQNLNAVTHANGRYVAVGLAGTMLRSFDGRRWTQHPHVNIHYEAVAHGGVPGAMRFIAVGQRFVESVGGYRGAAAYSDDGANWEVAASPSSAGLRALAWGNGRFVAVGDAGTALVSVDGTKWIAPTEADPTRSFSRLVFGAGVFIALGRDSSGQRIFVSPDAETWTPVALPIASVSDLTWNGSGFLAISYEGRSLFSTNGFNWQVLDGPVFGEYVRIAWNGREYRAIGFVVASTIGVSIDGVHWRNEETNTVGSPHALASDGLQWVAVGRRGRVLVAGDVILTDGFD